MTHQRNLFPDDPEQQDMFDAQGQGDPPAARRPLTPADIDRVRDVAGFPIATDAAIIALSDPPHYTACPNPFLPEIVARWQQERDASGDADYHREPFAFDVSEGKNDPIYNAHSYHTKVPHKAIMRYILHYTQPGDIVFDGFCGTGMTGVAAQLCGDRAAVESLGYRVDADGTVFDGDTPFSRLGARKAVLCDLSPAATFIAYNYNTPVDVAAFEREARRILAEVEQECGWMYETRHSDGSVGRINYTVWSDVFSCPDCGGEIIFWEAAVDKEAGAVRDSFPCPHCGAEQTKRRLERAWRTLYDAAIDQTIEQAKQVPVLINYSVGKKRHEKAPDEDDLALIERIERSQIPYWFPTDHMPKGDKTSDPLNLGITHAHHFYTKRNLWVMASFVQKASISNFPLRLLFLAMGSLPDLLKFARLRIGAYFHGGRGAVSAGVSGTLYIPSLSVEKRVLFGLSNRLDTLIQIDVWRRFAHHSVITAQSSSHDFSANSGSLDYIFIDPPFGGNLMYSELNFLWETWLKARTNNQEEAVVNKSQQKTLRDYQELIKECFTGFHRMLKPGRWITVEFHNSSSAVWSAIQEAMQIAGLVIADVRTFDKKQGSFNQVNAVGAVKSDLIISAYKPPEGFEREFAQVQGSEAGAWAFVREHLATVPVFVSSQGKAEIIAERLPYLLFDRMVAFHLQRGASVPLSAAEFYAGLKLRFPERDGMHFLEAQAAEYDQRRAEVGDVEQFTFYVNDEKSSIQWLRQVLRDGPQSYQQIQPRFLQELQQNRNEVLPELRDLLVQNFLQDEQGRWYIPDPTKQVDLEKLRRRELLREFESYQQGRGKLKTVRSEAVRAGFEQAYRAQDYATILKVAARLPEAVLREDSTVLTYYDLAAMEMEE